MPRNEKAIKQYYQPFLTRLKGIVKQNPGIEYWKAFLIWYIEAKFTLRTREYITDSHNDGIIDAVVWLPDGSCVVIQSKYNGGYASLPPNVKKIPPSEYQPFDVNTIPSFKDKKSWEEYLKRENIPPDKVSKYTEVFELYQKDKNKVKFEFITTYDPPSQMQKQFTYFDTNNLKGINEIINLFELEQSKQNPPADDLVLERINEFAVKDLSLGVHSRVIRTNVKDIVDYMQTKTNPLSIISKNVRVALPSSDINTGLLHTYEKKPEEFWYSHNGITIICEKLREFEDGQKQKLRLESPNIINGAQTVMTLKESKKLHENATVLAKIFEVETSEKTKQLIYNIIVRTNSQNPILYRDLRANEPVMYEISEYFSDRKVFFERRRGEKNLLKARIKNQKSFVLTPENLGQIIQISNNGPKGIMDSKESKEKMFKEDEDFEKIFQDTLKPDMYFQYVVRKLIVDAIFKEIQMRGKGYLLAAVSGIFWDVIKNSGITYDEWKRKANADLSLLSFKNHSNKLMDLKIVTKHIIEKCDRIRSDMNWPKGKEGFKLFIDKKDGLVAVKRLFRDCKKDKGKGKKGRLRNLSNSVKSLGIYQDIRTILRNYLSDYDSCPDCNKLTDFGEKNCTHCDYKF